MKTLLFVAGLVVAILIVEFVVPAPAQKALISVRHVIRRERTELRVPAVEPPARLERVPRPSPSPQPTPPPPAAPPGPVAPPPRIDARDVAKIGLSLVVVSLAAHLFVHKGSTKQDHATAVTLVTMVGGWWFV